MGKNKRPRVREEPHPQKIPKALPLPNYRNERPSWRVSEMLMIDGQFGWHAIDGDALRKIQERLKSFETQTWNEILSHSRRQNHYMPVSEICKEAQNLLEQRGLGDTDALVSLRIGKSERLWGILQGATLLILWWDPDHAVYPMNIAEN